MNFASGFQILQIPWIRHFSFDISNVSNIFFRFLFLKFYSYQSKISMSIILTSLILLTKIKNKNIIFNILINDKRWHRWWWTTTQLESQIIVVDKKNDGKKWVTLHLRQRWRNYRVTLLYISINVNIVAEQRRSISMLTSTQT